jgi:hypothetical protein
MKQIRPSAHTDLAVWATGWREQEEAALRRLAGTRGLAIVPLEPCSDLIQLVTFDGEHLGHVRLDGMHGLQERWVAVSKAAADTQLDGSYATAGEAAAALARTAGKTIRKTG